GGGVDLPSALEARLLIRRQRRRGRRRNVARLAGPVEDFQRGVQLRFDVRVGGGFEREKFRGLGVEDYVFSRYPEARSCVGRLGEAFEKRRSWRSLGRWGGDRTEKLPDVLRAGL